MDLRPALVDAAAAHRRRGRRTALLVRHAERDAIVDISRHEDAMLTHGGHAAAAAGGRLLAAGIDDEVVLLHSPVPRCKETAVGLHRGLIEGGRSARVGGDQHALGASYLKDTSGLARAYLKHGKHFVRAWFDGEIDRAYIDSCDTVAERQLTVLKAALQVDNFVVAVSHDWNIAALKEHALGLRFEDVGWPKFLDGVVVWFDKERDRMVIDSAS